MESNLLNPYNVDYNEKEQSYSFNTKLGIEYHVFFLDASGYDFKSEEVYMFNIERVENDTPQPIDVRISHTITSILDKFFQQKKHAIIIVCDNNDGKERKRNKIFQRWFDKYNNGKIIKIDKCCQTEDYCIYASLFFDENNPDKTNITKTFNELAQNGFIPHE